MLVPDFNFGGHGSRVMKRIATALNDHPLILMCGRHASLARALREPRRPELTLV